MERAHHRVDPRVDRVETRQRRGHHLTAGDGTAADHLRELHRVEPPRLAVLAADLAVAAAEPPARERVAHAATSGQTSGMVWSSTETMRSISGRVRTSGGASTRVLPRCAPPPERPTITPRSWQRSTSFLIWGAGMMALDLRSTTSSTPA